MEKAKPSNGNNPTAFSAHSRRRDNQGQGFKPRFKEGRKGRCFNCNKFGHFARECPHKKDTPRDGDNNNNNNFKGNDNQRNNRFNNKGKRNAPVARNGGGRPPKKSRNSRYDEVNVVKRNEFYLISALSTACPPDTLDHWLIDSGASRHFTG